MAVASYVDKFRDEFVAHLDGGGCPFEDSPLEGILAPSPSMAHAHAGAGCTRDLEQVRRTSLGHAATRGGPGRS